MIFFQLWQHQSQYSLSSPINCMTTSKMALTNTTPPPLYVIVVLADSSIHCLSRDTLKQVSVQFLLFRTQIAVSGNIAIEEPLANDKFSMPESLKFQCSNPLLYKMDKKNQCNKKQLKSNVCTFAGLKAIRIERLNVCDLKCDSHVCRWLLLTWR